VTNDFLVGAVEVGVRIDHPRIADLDLHLVSPQGTRLLLSENRGHTNIAYGVTLTNEIEIAGLPVFEDGFGTTISSTTRPSSTPAGNSTAARCTLTAQARCMAGQRTPAINF